MPRLVLKLNIRKVLNVFLDKVTSKWQTSHGIDFTSLISIMVWWELKYTLSAGGLIMLEENAVYHIDQNFPRCSNGWRWVMEMGNCEGHRKWFNSFLFSSNQPLTTHSFETGTYLSTKWPLHYIRIKMFHCRKVTNQNTFMDLQWCFPLREQLNPKSHLQHAELPGLY